MRSVIVGLLVGLVGGTALALLVKPVNHDYVASQSRVTVDGRVETFEILLPQDQLLNVGAGVAPEAVLPAGRSINGPRLSALRAEVYQLRDINEEVVGVVSRLSDSLGSVDDWVLYMPARGALFLSGAGSELSDASAGVGSGRVVGGSGTFADQRGRFELTSVAAADTVRIRLKTMTQTERP
ncbi:MAG: hypothetical protein AAGH76_12555 [Pseudomonadota bacterium]